MELFRNAQFYYKLGTLISYFTNHKKKNFSCYESLLKFCIPDAPFETVLTSEVLVQHEAFYNCHDRHWPKLLYILALSSIIGRNIHTFYPDFGLEIYKVLFNNIVNPFKLPFQ